MRADDFLDAAPSADDFLDEVGTAVAPRRAPRGREKARYVAGGDPADPIKPGGSVLEDMRMPAPSFDEDRRGRALVDATIAKNQPAPRAPRPQRDAKAVAQDLFSVLGNTGVQIVKPFVDVPNMLTGGALDPVAKFLDNAGRAANEAASPTTNYDRATLAAMPEGASLDKVGHILSNPGLAANMGLPSVGSLAMPLALAKGAALAMPKTAAALGDTFGTGAAVTANSLMNAGDTFGQTEADLPGRLLAALFSGTSSALVGKATGGGLEGQLARGQRSGGWLPAVKAVGNESLQEFGENVGNQFGQDTGEGKPLNVAKALDEGAIGAVLAPFVSGPVNVHQVLTDPGRANARVLADAINGFDASAPLTQPVDQSISQPAGPRFDPVAAAAAMQPPAPPAPAIPQLGFDPNVKPATIVVDPQGTARPMSADEFLDADNAKAQAEATGLTPDVVQAQKNRSEPTPEPPAPSDLVDRLRATGWTPPQEGNNPNPDPGVVQGIGADLEKLYQQDVKAGIKERMGLDRPSDPAPAEPKPQASAFRAFLREHGIAPELASDVTGDSGFRAHSLLPRTFRKGGLQLDELVTRAVERGFLTDSQVESALDNGGTNRLLEMIQEELRGNTQVSSEQADDTSRRAIDQRESDDLDARARAIGFDTTGLDEMKVADALKRIERRRARAQARKEHFDALRETKAEREAMRDAQDLSSLDDADIPWDNESNVSTEDAMRSLGFTEQEIAHATANEPAGAPEGRSGSGAPGQDAAGRAEGAPGADQGSPGGQPAPAAQEGLTSYTPEELRARDERIASQAKAEAKQQAEADAKDKAERERRDIASRQDKSAESFQLGQSPEDSLSGQSGIFDAPAAESTAARAEATPPAPKPVDVVDLRKRLSVLRSLRECLA